MECPSCRFELAAKNDGTPVTCERCGAIIPASPPALVQLPARYDVTESPERIAISFAPPRTPAIGQLIGIVTAAAAFFFIRARWGYASGYEVIFAAFIAVLCYRTLALFIDRVRVEVDPKGVRTGYRPLWLPGRSARLASTEIERFYASRGDGDYAVVAIRAGDRRRIPLVSGLNDPAQAFWLTQAFEKMLGVSRGDASL